MIHSTPNRKRTLVSLENDALLRPMLTRVLFVLKGGADKACSGAGNEEPTQGPLGSRVKG